MTIIDPVQWDEPRLVHRMLRYREGKRPLLMRMRVPALVVVAILVLIACYQRFVLPTDSQSESIAVGLFVFSALIVAVMPYLPVVPQAARRQIVLSAAYLTISTNARELTGGEMSLSEMTRVEVLKGLADYSCFDMLRFEHPEHGITYVGLSDSVDKQQVLDVLGNAGVQFESTGRRMRLEIEDDSPFVDHPRGEMTEAEVDAAMRACPTNFTGEIRWTEPLAAVRMWQRARFSLDHKWFARVLFASTALLVGFVCAGLLIVCIHFLAKPIRGTDFWGTLTFGGLGLAFLCLGVIKLLDICENRCIHLRSTGGVLVDRADMSEYVGPRLVVDEANSIGVDVGPPMRPVYFVPYDRVERAEIVSKRNCRFLRLITNDGEGYAFGLGARNDPQTLLSFVNRCLAGAAGDTPSDGYEKAFAGESETPGDSIPVAQPVKPLDHETVMPTDNSAPPSESAQEQSEEDKPGQPVDEELVRFLKGLA